MSSCFFNKVNGYGNIKDATKMNQVIKQINHITDYHYYVGKILFFCQCIYPYFQVNLG